MDLKEKIKDKIMGPSGVVLSDEDAEAAKIQQLVKIFGGLLELKDPENYIDVELNFSDHTKPDAPTSQINLNQMEITCGFCTARNDIVKILKEPKYFIEEISDLQDTIIYNVNWAKINEKIISKQIDEFEAIRELRALHLTAEKKGLRFREVISGTILVNCQKCTKTMGSVSYIFKMKNTHTIREISWTEFDGLKRPPPEIISRICVGKLGIHPTDFEAWLSCNWVDKVKAGFSTLKKEFEQMILPEDVEYQLTSFFSEAEVYIDEFKKKRLHAYHNALSEVVNESLGIYATPSERKILGGEKP